ncbi:hypothetical protein [Vibrio rumoiensis]|uniref:hypothetical protein n=1 Tax=Vibrio rumoiensis TaxID=76258 RepID=UPI003AA7D708
MDTFKEVAVILWYVTLFWSIPGIIISITIAMGSYKHIINIDKNLAKDLDKIYYPNGQMKDMIFTTIANRFHRYCVAYPFIRKRAKNSSMKFKIFMWFNSIGYWCWISIITLVLIGKLLGI